MDFGTTLKHLAPFAVPIVALLIPIVAIALSMLARMRRTEHLHLTTRQMLAQGQPVPPELLETIVRDARQERASRPWSSMAQLRTGAIHVALGCGLVLLFLVMDPHEWFWALGCVPLFIGTAILLVWRYESRQATAAAGRGERES